MTAAEDLMYSIRTLRAGPYRCLNTSNIRKLLRIIFVLCPFSTQIEDFSHDLCSHIASCWFHLLDQPQTNEEMVGYHHSILYTMALEVHIARQVLIIMPRHRAL